MLKNTMIDFLIAAGLSIWIISGVLDYNLIIDGIIRDEPDIKDFEKFLIFVFCIIAGPISLKRHFNNTKKGK